MTLPSPARTSSIARAFLVVLAGGVAALALVPRGAPLGDAIRTDALLGVFLALVLGRVAVRVSPGRNGWTGGMLGLVGAGSSLGITMGPSRSLTLDLAAAAFGALSMALLGLVFLSAVALYVTRVSGLDERDLWALAEDRRRRQDAALRNEKPPPWLGIARPRIVREERRRQGAALPNANPRSEPLRNGEEQRRVQGAVIPDPERAPELGGAWPLVARLGSSGGSWRAGIAFLATCVIVLLVLAVVITLLTHGIVWP